MAERDVVFRVKRYRPTSGSKPTYQEYRIPYRDDMVVLDGLNYIKDHVDPTLTYRWSCRMGICGSCGANVNGQPTSCAAEHEGRCLGMHLRRGVLRRLPEERGSGGRDSDPEGPRDDAAHA